MSEPWGDIPLFREIQRILASSKGPVNLEMATQVGTALATQEGDSAPDPGRARALSDAVRQSELVLGGYTRLPVEEPATVRTMGRADWTKATLGAWGWLFERVAQKLSGGMPGIGGPEEEAPARLAAAMGQVAPLLVGIQVGTLVGQLARGVVGRYDHPIPREDEGHLVFVDPNVARLVTDYGFDEAAFVRWLGLGSAARHLVVSQAPWIDRYWRSLLAEVVDAMEIDVGELQTRMMDLQSQGPDALQAGGGVTLPLVPTDRHQRALARLRSFLAAVEGYARHATGAVGESVVGPVTQIEEGMARHRLQGSEAESMLKTILGVSLDRDLESAGATFCAAVVKLKGIAALNTMWAAPDNLPSYEEVKDPFAWMERVLDEG